MVMTIGKLLKGEHVFIPKNPNDIFDREDKMDTLIVYIKNIKGSPDLFKRFGNIYLLSRVETIGSPEKLYTSNTIKTLLDLGLITHEYNEENPICNDWLLSELIQNENGSEKGALSAVYEDNMNLYDKKKLTALISLAGNPVALDWLFDNGAQLAEVKGYGNPVDAQEISGSVRGTMKNIEYLLKKFKSNNIQVLRNKVKNYSK